MTRVLIVFSDNTSTKKVPKEATRLTRRSISFHICAFPAGSAPDSYFCTISYIMRSSSGRKGALITFAGWVDPTGLGLMPSMR